MKPIDFNRNVTSANDKIHKINVFWFRRDLRLKDNTALNLALEDTLPVRPIFIFDDSILDELKKDDPRVQFIHNCLERIQSNLVSHGSGLEIWKGKPIEVWGELLSKYQIKTVYTNKDYEPYALRRDTTIKKKLNEQGVSFKSFKDQVIFEESEVVKPDGTPYTIFTPYSKKWKAKLDKKVLALRETKFSNLVKQQSVFPSLEQIGFKDNAIKVKPINFNKLETYEQIRDYPALDQTSYLSPHLRFGTVSIRKMVSIALKRSECFLNELIWREFFMQILYHFPEVVNSNFRSKYDGIKWRNKEEEFEKWKQGKTGYPIVDAGMRQLNKTGYMHNRVRMIVASFLCKHLLIDWKWGEAYFAEKLLDYELSSNNGNWQWAAGTGCDAAPYFRVFNPYTQTKRFDPDLNYIRKWVDEYDSLTYPAPMVDHKMARKRALDTYKRGIEQ